MSVNLRPTLEKNNAGTAPSNPNLNNSRPGSLQPTGLSKQNATTMPQKSSLKQPSNQTASYGAGQMQNPGYGVQAPSYGVPPQGYQQNMNQGGYQNNNNSYGNAQNYNAQQPGPANFLPPYAQGNDFDPTRTMSLAEKQKYLKNQNLQINTNAPSINATNLRASPSSQNRQFTADQAVRQLLQQLLATKSGRLNLVDCFSDFDPYAGRILSQWEFSFIFQEMREHELNDCISKISDANLDQTDPRYPRVQRKQVSLQYLIDSMANNSSCPTHWRSNTNLFTKSIYENLYRELILNDNQAEKILNLIVNLPDFTNSDHQLAYQKVFRKNSYVELVTCNEFKTILNQQFPQTQVQDQTAQKIVQFLNNKDKNFEFNAVHFKNAIRFLISYFKPEIAASIFQNEPMPKLEQPSSNNNMGPQNQFANQMQLNQTMMSSTGQQMPMNGMVPQNQMMNSQMQGTLPYQHQNSLGPNQFNQMGQPQQMGQQQQWQQNQQMQFQQQVPIQQPPWQQQQQVQQQQMPHVNQPSMMGGSGPLTPAQEQATLPPEVKRILNKMINTLAQTGQSFDIATNALLSSQGGGAMYQGAASGQIQAEEFKRQVIKMFSLEPTEAFNLASFFTAQTNTNPPMVDIFKLQRFAKFATERFQGILSTFGFEMNAILDQLDRVQKSGVFRWFQNYNVLNRNMESSLTQDEFLKAIQNLNLPGFDQTRYQQLFTYLDFSNSQKVYVHDIEALFKTYRKMNQSGINKQNELANILNAFNCDIQFIQSTLRTEQQVNQNLLTTEKVTNFFQRQPNHDKFYNMTNVKILVELFAHSEERFDLDNFVQELQQVQRDRNIQARPHHQGVHRSAGASSTQWNPLTPFNQFSEDMTRSSQENSVTTSNPNGSLSINEKYIKEIQMACFVNVKKLVQDHFSSFVKQSTNLLDVQQFMSAIQSLGLNWPSQLTQDIFSQIDAAWSSHMSTTNPSREISAKSIDLTVAKLCNQSMKDQHAQLLRQILNSFKVMENTRQNNHIGQGVGMQKETIEDFLERSINSSQSYNQFSGGAQNNMGQAALYQKTCTMNDLTRVLNQDLRVDLDHLQLAFLASQYTLPGANDRIYYVKLIEDFKNIQRSGSDQKSEDSAATLIVKKLKTIDKNVRQFTEEKLERGQAFNIKLVDFLNLFGQRLGLVPVYCEEHKIRQLFNQIDSSSTGIVTQENIVSVIEKQAGSEKAILNSLLVKLAETKISYEINNSQEFTMNSGSLTRNTFRNILISLYINEIDIDYLLTFNNYFSRNSNLVSATSLLRDIQEAQGKMFSEKGAQLTPEQDVLARNILKNIAKMPNTQPIYQSLSALQRDRRSNFVTWLEFKTALERVVPYLNENEKLALFSKYKHPHKESEFDLVVFLSDLKQMENVIKVNMTQLTTQQQNFYNQVSQSLLRMNKDKQLVRQLKSLDTRDTGYLTASHLLKALDNCFQNNDRLNRGFELNQNTQNLLVGPLAQSKERNGYSYQEMLCHLFGRERGIELFMMNTRDIERPTNTGSFGGNIWKRPERVGPTTDPRYTRIGEHLLNSMRNYEDKFRQILGFQGTKTMKLYQNDFYKAFSDLGLQFLPEERNKFDEWFMMNKDSQNQASVINFLSDVGLPAQTLHGQEAAKVKKLELNEQQLRRCKGVMDELIFKFQQMGKRASLIDKYKSNQNLLTPAEWNNFMKTESPPEFYQKLKDKNYEIMNHLVHYLVREEFGHISIQKFYQAFNQTRDEAPLPQDKLDEIRSYKNKLMQSIDDSRDGSVPVTVIDLNRWMHQEQISTQDLFKLGSSRVSANTVIDASAFKEYLEQRNYVRMDKIDKLIADLAPNTNDPNSRILRQVSLGKLEAYKKQLAISDSKRGNTSQLKYSKFRPLIREKLQKISNELQKRNISAAELHQRLDINNDGVVDKDEFRSGMSLLQIPGLLPKDYEEIFQGMDIDQDHFLSVNEFNMYMEGAQKSRQERIKEIPYEIMHEIDKEIEKLFNQIDDNGDKRLSLQEIQKALNGLGMQKTFEEIRIMIAPFDSNRNDYLELEEFKQLMKPQILDSLLNQDDQDHKFRAMFLEADTDFSGFLTPKEIYTVLSRYDVNISEQDLIELITEFDYDGSCELDIDEFVQMMNMGSEVQFTNNQAKNTYLKLRRFRAPSVSDFFSAFGSLPQSFTVSFTYTLFQKNKNRPSNCLKVQVDPKTMSWKDMKPINPESLLPEERENRPFFNPVENLIGSEITIEIAEGIPLPKRTEQFVETNVCGRAVRVILFNEETKEFISNASQVAADWDKNAEDQWTFSKAKSSDLNPVLVRLTKDSNLDTSKIKVIFELILYYKAQKKVNEVCCGFAEIEIDQLNRDQINQPLQIKGGTPQALVEINKQDVQDAKRHGLKRVFQMFSGDTKTCLKVSHKRISALSNSEADIRQHIRYLPSVCVIQKRLVHFVSGYRNYAANFLGSSFTDVHMKQPEGDAIMSTFPKIIDCIDTLDLFTLIWQEDVIKNLNENGRKSMKTIVEKTKDFILKVYPIIHSDGFNLTPVNEAECQIADIELYKLRRDLLNSTLRYGENKKQLDKTLREEPIHTMTTFKPFNIRETLWEVWDNQGDFKREQLTNEFQRRSYRQ